MAKSKDHVDLVHSEYAEHAECWKRARDVIEGEDEIKEHGEEYLPKLDQQTAGEYEAYKERAKFLNATGRTLTGLTGLVFRKQPIVKIGTVTGLTEQAIAALVDDITLSGESLINYAQRTIREVVSVARGGTLIDYVEGEARTTFGFYRTESIWNWRTERIDGRMMLSMLLLYECSDIAAAPKQNDEVPVSLASVASEEVETLRLIRLEQQGQSRICTVEVFRKVVENDKVKWVSAGKTSPSRRGVVLDFIPFVFHKVADSMPCCEKIPLADLVSVNLHHYRLSADYNHGLHFTALPTPWVTGFKLEADKTLKIGSTTAWVIENPAAKAGYLEFQGQGLSAIKEALEDDKKDMTILGARLLEEQKRDAETAETQRMRQSGESSILASIASTASRALTDALKIALWWMSTAPNIEALKEVSIQLNTDFTSERMQPAELTALVNTWVRGGMSRETLIWNMQQGEMLEPGMTVQEEIDRISDDVTELGKASDGRDAEKDKKDKKDKKDEKA